MAHEVKFDLLLEIVKNKMADAIFTSKGLELLNTALVIQGKKRIKYGDKNALAKCRDVVSHWDIRQVHQLAEIFPNIVPKWVANCKIEYRDTPKGSIWYLVENK